MNEILIRPAAVADAPAWLAMRVALYGDDPSLKSEIDGFFAGTSPIEAVYIADDGEPAGFVELGTRPYAEGCTTSPVAYVEATGVVSEGFVLSPHRHPGESRDPLNKGNAGGAARVGRI